MKTKAVIDRFEGDKAVLAVGEEQDRLVVLRSFLPKGAKEGDWLKVDVEDDRVISVALDPNETASAKNRIVDKLARLRKGEHRG
jgi:transcriptional regulator of NAD metabolism